MKSVCGTMGVVNEKAVTTNDKLNLIGLTSYVPKGVAGYRVFTEGLNPSGSAKLV